MGSFDNTGKLLDLDKDVIYVGHEGASPSLQAMAFLRLGKGYGAVMMANSESGFALFGEVGRALAYGYGWDGCLPPIEERAPDPSTLASMEGTYATSPGLSTLTVKAREHRLVVHRIFAPTETELVAIGDGTFVALDTNNRFHFDDKTRRLTVSRRGKSATYRRLDPGETTPTLELEARLERAVVECRRLYATDPLSPVVSQEGLDDLGVTLFFYLGLREAGIAVLRVNAELHPTSMGAFSSLGRALVVAGDRGAAAEAFRASLAAFNRDHDSTPEIRDQLRYWADWELQRLDGH